MTIVYAGTNLRTTFSVGWTGVHNIYCCTHIGRERERERGTVMYNITFFVYKLFRQLMAKENFKRLGYKELDNNAEHTVNNKQGT